MKKIAKPQNSIKHILAPNLIQKDFKEAMKYINKLVKSGDTWKFNYGRAKSILSQTLKRSDYADAVKQLNIIVRPYRQRESK